jgi:glycosyltransferase involved in cell wall biosynthesis
MMKVSIVTISFNQAEYVERAIQSVLAQDYPDIEYIVADPGSTDGSREIIERYRPQIATTILRPDQGAADGLNGGFAEATGDIFGFLNSDDMLLPGAVSSAISFLEKHKEIDVVSGHSNLVGPDDRFLRRVYSDRMFTNAYAYGAIFLMQASTFFRRGIFDRVGGFNVKNKISWDGELFLNMALAGGKFAVADQFWSAYRIHEGSITGTKSNKERLQRSHAEIFSTVMGRPPGKADAAISFGYRLRRKILNPRDTWERVLRGPVFGRSLGS